MRYRRRRAVRLLLLWGAALRGAAAAGEPPASPRRLAHQRDGCVNGAGALSSYGATRFVARVGDYDRHWYVKRPAAAGLRPLVLDMHGWTYCPSDQVYLSGWTKIADADGVVVVWPAGTQEHANSTSTSSSWHSGGCCSASYFAKVDDVAFLRHVVEAVAADGGVDLGRVYAAGHSNGCKMAQRLALEAPDLVAGVGCAAGYAAVSPVADWQPLNFIEVHGARDVVVPYAGWCCDTDPRRCFDLCPSLDHDNAVLNLERWRRWNGCSSDAAEVDSGTHVIVTHDRCARGVRAALVTLPGVGHLPYYDHFGYFPGWPEAAVDTTAIVWDFLRGARNTWNATTPFDWETAVPPADNATAQAGVLDAAAPRAARRGLLAGLAAALVSVVVVL